MNEIDLVGESIKFMVLGMTIVFTFLYLMILLVQLQAYLINRFFPEKKPPSTTVGGDEEAKVTAAIIAAIAEHKKYKSSK